MARFNAIVLAVVALMLAAASPALAGCRQIGNADYCHGDTQSKCCRSVDSGYFYGCMLANNNFMCDYDRALQVCCHPSFGGRKLLGAPTTAPINATLAIKVHPSETLEVRDASKPKPSDKICISTCKAAPSP